MSVDTILGNDNDGDGSLLLLSTTVIGALSYHSLEE